MVLADSSGYPLLNLIWTMIVFFAWVIWIWLLITIFADLFRRPNMSGWAKAGWVVVLLVLPFVGVLIYLIANGRGMTERRTQQVQQAQSDMDDYVRSVSSQTQPADQIARGKQLLDSGAISPQEFETLKQKALAA
jgi:phospholipase D-like protein